MQYREYGKTGIKLSALSMGSTRFLEQDLNDSAGLERCADIVEAAARMGVNFFDISHNYAKSKCEAIYKIAFKRLRKQGIPFYSSSKTMSTIDPTSDDVLRRVETALQNLGLEQIDFFYIWSILSSEHYQEIMQKNGPYEGALKAKEQGLIRHIIFSSHAPVKTTVNIIESQAFEGILISFSLLNYMEMLPVLEAARNKGIGIGVMNPLAGGIIPQNLDYFSRMLQLEPNQIISAAHRFLLAHEGVTTLLSGVKSIAEIENNVKETFAEGPVSPGFALQLYTKMEQMNDLCTGCGYCGDCPAGIPISSYMRSFNMTFLGKTQSSYNRTDKDLIKRISVMRKLQLDYQFIPETPKNPCLRCGKCESQCTQHLPVMERIRCVTEIADISGATQEQHKERLKKLLYDKNYQRVAFYTGGGYTAHVIEEYIKYFGKPEFEISILDSSSDKWGKKLGDYTIHSPKEITNLKPACILITNYNFQDAIYNDLLQYKELGVEIVKLHNKSDTPWVF